MCGKQDLESLYLGAVSEGLYETPKGYFMAAVPDTFVIVISYNSGSFQL